MPQRTELAAACSAELAWPALYSMTPGATNTDAIAALPLRKLRRESLSGFAMGWLLLLVVTDLNLLQLGIMVPAA